MLEQIKVVTSRRAYEFRPDDVRLSALCTKPVQEQIQKLFQFQAAVMGTPIATFGEVPATYPPGFVFNMGVWVTPDEQLVPIRFLHFEQYRIVIDVAGTSDALTPIFERLQQFLSGLNAPDGSPVIGEPEHILDFSEITAKYPFPLDAVLSQPFSKALKAVSGINTSSNMILIPLFTVQPFPVNQKVAAIPGPNTHSAFTFALRSGTQPEDHIYISSAPLDSETHLSYLNELEAALRA